MSNSTPRIVITGAAGHLGGLVADALADRTRDLDRITLTARDVSRLAVQLERGFRVAHADFEAPVTLDAAFRGADVLFLVSSPASVPERQAQHRAAIDAAKRAGVKRVVYTSFVNSTHATRFPFAEANVDTEDYLKASGLAYTIARNGQYIENLDATLAQSRQDDTLAIAGARGKVAYIGRDELARALAELLLNDAHAGHTYELTGPEALSIADIAQQLSAERGRPVKVVDVPTPEYAGLLASFGLPEFLVEGLSGMYDAAAAGEYATVSRDAERILGRPVHPVAGYVKRFA